MSALDDKIEGLRSTVERNTTVGAGMLAFVQGVPALIEQAKQDALAAGATEAQLQSLTDLETNLTAESDAFEAALLANTPQDPGTTGRRKP